MTTLNDRNRPTSFKGGVAELVMAAYEIPSYGVEELQRTIISEYENKIFAECYKAVTSDSEE